VIHRPGRGWGFAITLLIDYPAAPWLNAVNVGLGHGAPQAAVWAPVEGSVLEYRSDEFTRNQQALT